MYESDYEVQKRLLLAIRTKTNPTIRVHEDDPVEVLRYLIYELTRVNLFLLDELHKK